jgi:hypothetical protein
VWYDLDVWLQIDYDERRDALETVRGLLLAPQPELLKAPLLSQ